MKGKNYLIAYISALVIGILLLVYHSEAGLYNTLVIAIGALIAVPGLVLLILEFRHKKTRRRTASTNAEIAERDASNWATVITGVAGMALGIWMICSPAFFIKAIIYTLGAILILVGVLQCTGIYQAARPLRPLAFWFVIPALTLVAGVIILVLGPDRIASAAGLIAGIVLVVYAANGFAATGREAKEKANSSEEK